MNRVTSRSGAGFLLLGLLVVGCFAGCGGEPASQGKPDAPPAVSVENKVATIKVMSLEEVESRIKQLKGKVVVVDLWATWCQHCVEELPHLVKLQEKYPEQLHTVTVNVEYSDEDGAPPEELQNSAKKVLTRCGATGENILCSDPITTSLEKYETGLPAALVYDADGNLVQKFDGTVDYEGEVEPLVAKLLQ